MNGRRKYMVESLPEYGDAVSAIYLQREMGETHTPFEFEYLMCSAIRCGDGESLLRLAKRALKDGLVIGNMSPSNPNRMHYWAVSLIATSVHYAILGGMDETDAYNFSDDMIQTVDKMTDFGKCIDYLLSKAQELTDAVNKAQNESGVSVRVRKCIHYIHIHLHEKIEIPVLADEIGVSCDYLSVLFKKEMGTGIHRYITDEKLKAAKTMLYRDMKISQISYTLAFSSESHFVALFRKKYGITPGRYKKELKI